MSFKDKIKERTYKNAEVLNLSYKDKKGNTKTEEVILKKSNSFLGDWRKIHPIINKDNSINIMNLIFGGWRNAVKLTLIGLFALYLIFGVFGEMTEYMDGNKYIIVSRDTFFKFCEMRIENQNITIEYGNFSNINIMPINNDG